MTEDEDARNMRSERLRQLITSEIFNFDHKEVDENLNFEHIQHLIDGFDRANEQSLRYWFKVPLSLPVHNVRFVDENFNRNQINTSLHGSTVFTEALNHIKFSARKEIKDSFFQTKINALGAELENRAEISGYQTLYQLHHQTRDYTFDTTSSRSKEDDVSSCFHNFVLSHVSCIINFLFPFSCVKGQVNADGARADYIFINNMLLENERQVQVKVLPIEMKVGDISNIHIWAQEGSDGKPQNSVAFSIMHQLFQYAVLYHSDVVVLSDFEKTTIIKFLFPLDNTGGNTIEYDFRCFNITAAPITVKWVLAALVYHKLKRRKSDITKEKKKIESFYLALIKKKKY
ncbi:hypothetical protein DASC09_019390 [Saccharomycopsis crataegensis]|uniref:Uncharacterized protein n=1 Tax=Saccharomycopsis crataegensis TaxID=43959 RepID=A0AAV5QIP6_9ASCO|nr:hypothetical protein DASC09_019390 [Saccharomycopsis crataegensis]